MKTLLLFTVAITLAISSSANAIEIGDSRKQLMEQLGKKKPVISNKGYETFMYFSLNGPMSYVSNLIVGLRGERVSDFKYIFLRAPEPTEHCKEVLKSFGYRLDDLLFPCTDLSDYWRIEDGLNRYYGSPRTVWVYASPIDGRERRFVTGAEAEALFSRGMAQRVSEYYSSEQKFFIRHAYEAVGTVGLPSHELSYFSEDAYRERFHKKPSETKSIEELERAIRESSRKRDGL